VSRRAGTALEAGRQVARPEPAAHVHHRDPWRTRLEHREQRRDPADTRAVADARRRGDDRLGRGAARLFVPLSCRRHPAGRSATVGSIITARARIAGSPGVHPVRVLPPFVAAVLSWLASEGAGFSVAPVALYRESRRVMGTLCEVQAYHADADTARQAISRALDEMQRVDRLLTNYQPASELSSMNNRASKAPFRASRELYDFVKRCRGYFDDTLGTFDPTLGPVVRAWGFFTPHPATPTPQDAAAAKARSGFDNVRLDDDARSVSYTVEGLELDPGGIGKGYAADRAVAVLRQSGIVSALVSAGGSTLYAMGHPPNREGWEVAVRDPSTPASFLRWVTLRDRSLSTSGVSEKSIQADGHTYGHIFDPRTGDPVENMCQVTLLADTATDSDALTKAAFILPRESLVNLFAARGTVHVLRVEGACASRSAIWTTPWSAGVFRESAAKTAAEK
jgi:thiamine biosynthesis lipoprotein